ncbi:MAG: peptidoglycan binding protein CsiV [Gammaproteobacteria bacterium]|nr:peptidoglycan binding protein CsiV [Gammaproteobacteria bacterium]NNF48883.1 hypothetical protein [Woeseiaceae bacterium]MBT8095006.1 peptidoglycan binding protein CsiV [Gammaproteobacteria bacterium]MBT8104676.1 peptidoglycan binding protein CsiV [Gammaproteobacteria bacterium]NNK24690.1 hypothetical protein [Woeseiaceae bacterium]
MSMILKLALGVAGLALLAPAAAQDSDDESEIRRYAVEVIIFRYAQDVGSGNEIFAAAEPQTVLFGGPLPEAAEVPEPQPPRRTGPYPDIEFVRLMRDDYQLTDIYGRLRRLDAYDPIMHFGWTQATWAQEQTRPIPLRRFGRPPADLDGDLTLYLNRFLHLVVDLELGAASEAPVFYRIEEDRILKNGELRYYDHPKFGLLAKVTRVEEREDADELPGYPVQ